MGRVYNVGFHNVSVTAVQDLIAVYAGSTKAFKVHAVSLGQVTATAVGNLAISLRRLTSTVTVGSGGTTPSLLPVGPNDTAATVTAHANDTTQATTSGAVQYMVHDVFNVVNGYLYLPPEEDRITVGPGQAFIVSLDTAPGSAEAMSGWITVEELF